MSRHSARATAMQIIFQLEVGENTTEMAQVTLENANLKPVFNEFAWALAQGVVTNRMAIEEYIAKFSKEWDLARLANVDKAIISLAIYELLYTKETPSQIVINEAIELAKEFSTKEAPAFVNAVLDGFYHKVVIEDLPDYRPNLSLKALQTEAIADQEEIIAKAQAGEAVVVEDVAKPASKPEPTKKPAAKRGQFEANKRVNENANDGQAYRIIKKTEITPDDKIRTEDILADKKRMYGESAFLTPADVRRANLEGIELPAGVPIGDPSEIAKPTTKSKDKKDGHSSFKRAEARVPGKKDKAD